MKRLLQLILFILLAIGLVACSDKEETSDVTKGDEVTEPTKQNAEQDKEEVNDNESGDSEWGEDQLDLKIGDTGTVNNNFTSFEVTVNSVEFLEKAGEEYPQGDKFALIELTLKNLGEDSYTAEDILGSVTLADEPGSSGMSWFYVEGVAEEWPGEIGTNESQTGYILFDIYNSDQYFLQFGTFLDAVSNEVRFLFTDADAK
ncbi:hypothetical protein HNQ35_002276 [Cerasibacillus quisquiliarum]|uniref:DUF4352 domain-containing protein n=1 Tax=Cerasibacillus quisquiliarum TaxID=227865 RepID=UPI0016121B0A|nr:DUF4352 domain-containing protein [Cerasibacillus quisquiliarum]MBB5147059.1 hypothetical protein [Cerasibacillus quisquiliarum]